MLANFILYLLANYILYFILPYILYHSSHLYFSNDMLLYIYISLPKDLIFFSTVAFSLTNIYQTASNSLSNNLKKIVNTYIFSKFKHQAYFICSFRFIFHIIKHLKNIF